jgi:hypothetical protein
VRKKEMSFLVPNSLSHRVACIWISDEVSSTDSTSLSCNGNGLRVLAGVVGLGEQFYQCYGLGIVHEPFPFDRRHAPELA